MEKSEATEEDEWEEARELEVSLERLGLCSVRDHRGICMSAATLCWDILRRFGVSSESADEPALRCPGLSLSLRKKESLETAPVSSSRKMMFCRPLPVRGKALFLGAFVSFLSSLPNDVLRFPTEELSVTRIDLLLFVEEVEEDEVVDVEEDDVEKAV